MVYPRNKTKKLGSWAGWIAVTTTALVMAAVPLTNMAQVSAIALPTQSSNDRGVTVKVTPKSMGTPNGRWEFSVVLDTHSADINDDLMQSASLITDDGRTLKPISWTGAPPGGHHREGVLAFEVPTPMPGAIELRIHRAGETVARTFRWKP